jgi:hypothetical protein
MLTCSNFSKESDERIRVEYASNLKIRYQKIRGLDLGNS